MTSKRIKSHHRLFVKRLTFNILLACLITAASLCVGMIGYRITEKMAWIDAYLNATMILSGMGAVDKIQTTAGKIFAGTYAMFSGTLFLISVGIVLTPIFHHFTREFHVEDSKIE